MTTGGKPTIDESIPTLVTDDGRLTSGMPSMMPTKRYALGAVIARGGMGEIYEARDQLIGRDVAVKRLLGERPQRAMERFFREACIQGRLEHPAIVPVHDLGVDADGVPFFVMKKLAGTTLTNILMDPDPVRHSRQRLLRAFVEICYAIEFAHSRGCIHRDVKPDNIVLGEFGEVYVLDWGVARVAGSSHPTPPTTQSDPRLTRDGAAVGTPGYMSPEQARGERDLDARSDVFALGCILFEMLTLRRLLPATSTDVVGALRQLDARPSAAAPNGDIAPELDAICVRATAIVRDDRISSARELAVLVERFLDGDRDLEQRRRLAREQLERAMHSFMTADSTDSHRAAMRFAGRALALDPALEPAAALLGRLMLEPPREVPGEVVASLAKEDAAGQRRTARMGMLAHIGYIFVLAMLAGVGFAAPIYPIVFTALIVANMALFAWYERTHVVRSPWLPMIASAALIALIARMFSPFFVAPGLAAVVAMAFMLGMVPITRFGAWLTISISSAAVLLPWLAEQAGLVTRTFEITRDAIVMRGPGMQEETAVSVLVLAAYSIVLVASAVLMTSSIRRAELDARRRLHLQAWQLRQIVPIDV